MHSRRTRLDARGVTYLMVMFAIVLTGITLSAVGKHWKMIVQREKEADLLAKGMEIQNALALYSATMKAGRLVPMEVYPQSLAELTRLPKPYLRKVYSDPLSGGDWEYLRAPTGGIMGVRSKDKGKPIKDRDFPLPVRHFEGRKSYRDWMFQHPNPSSLSLLASPMGMGSPVMPFPGQAPHGLPPGFSSGLPGMQPSSPSQMPFPTQIPQGLPPGLPGNTPSPGSPSNP